MAAAALTLWAIHMAVNLVARSALHRRRTGRTGLVGVSGGLGAAEIVAAVAEVLAIGLGVAARFSTSATGSSRSPRWTRARCAGPDWHSDWPVSRASRSRSAPWDRRGESASIALGSSS